MPLLFALQQQSDQGLCYPHTTKSGFLVMRPMNLCFSYAPNGLSIRKLGALDNTSQSEVEIKFSPDIPSQLNLLARCQRDHPFFVKDKGIYHIYLNKIASMVLQ